MIPTLSASWPWHSIARAIFCRFNSETVITCAESSPRTLSVTLMTAKVIRRASPTRPSSPFFGNPIDAGRSLLLRTMRSCSFVTPLGLASITTCTGWLLGWVLVRPSIFWASFCTIRAGVPLGKAFRIFEKHRQLVLDQLKRCLLYTSPSPRDS